jgi:hypothetical protein
MKFATQISPLLNLFEEQPSLQLMTSAHAAPSLSICIEISMAETMQREGIAPYPQLSTSCLSQKGISYICVTGPKNDPLVASTKSYAKTTTIYSSKGQKPEG